VAFSPLSKPVVTEKVIEFIRKSHVLYDQSLIEYKDTQTGFCREPQLEVYFVSTTYVFVCACVHVYENAKPPDRFRNSDHSSNTLDMSQKSIFFKFFRNVKHEFNNGLITVLEHFRYLTNEIEALNLQKCVVKVAKL
jgi:hypothetical protein